MSGVTCSCKKRVTTKMRRAYVSSFLVGMDGADGGAYAISPVTQEAECLDLHTCMIVDSTPAAASTTLKYGDRYASR
jgi:hypothetical protein